LENWGKILSHKKVQYNYRTKRDTVSVSKLFKPGGRPVAKFAFTVKFLVLARFEDPYCDFQRLSSIYPYLLPSSTNALRIYRQDLSSQTIEVSSVI